MRAFQGDIAVEGDEYMTVQVSYRCTNTARRTHFLVGMVRQVVESDTVPARLVYGYRGDIGGTQFATCTGKRVRETLQFPLSAYSVRADPDLAPGPVDFSFSIERRGTPGVGPGWYTLYSTLTISHGVTAIDADS